MKNMRLVIGILVGVVAIIVAAVAFAPSIDSMLSGATASQSGENLDYPVNAAGETYGSPIGGTAPDLIVARSDDGDLGYVRVSELDLERNAAKSTTNPDALFSVVVYESDGVTEVGELMVTADTPGARDGFN